MRSFGTLLLALILSGVLAGAAQVQLGVFFKADVELVLAMVALAVATLVTTVVLGIVLATRGTTGAIDRTAGILFALTWLAAAALLAFDALSAKRVTRDGLVIVAEITVPILIMIAIQWWLVRRRAQRRTP